MDEARIYTRAEHLDQAKEVYAEGEDALTKVSELKQQLDELYAGTTSGLRGQIVDNMERLSRTALTCFTQANYHATMASIPDLLWLADTATRDFSAHESPEADV